MFRFTDSAARNEKKLIIKFTVYEHMTRSCYNGILKLCSCLCQWEETFENYLVRLKADRESRSTVLKTEISATDIFHPVHILDLDTPVHICQQFSSVLLSAIRMTPVRELVCGTRLADQ